jgi:hypothetical protein
MKIIILYYNFLATDSEKSLANLHKLGQDTDFWKITILTEPCKNMSFIYHQALSKICSKCL